QLLFLLGLGLVIFILLVRSKRYFRQVTQYQVPAGQPGKTALPKKAAASSRELEKWEVEMHDLARDLMGQLDSKVRVLELLIREANEAAARLEAARGKKGARDEGRGAREAGRRAADERTEQTAKPQVLQEFSQPIDRGALRRQKSGESRKPLQVANNPRFERVYALADAGMTAATIAKQIGTQVGEVELILSLRGKHQPEA
ncbi:MAG TPA: hypothetical protein VKB78_04720, partial [Pirellulales bacterium]|nr:hypothetical protein [Pirellulales bacterium]